MCEKHVPQKQRMAIDGTRQRRKKYGRINGRIIKLAFVAGTVENLRPKDKESEI